MTTPVPLRCLICATALLFPWCAQGAVFCATTSVGFQIALNNAAGNNEDDEIRLAVGTYTVLGASGFEYDVRPTGDDRDLVISGGWSEFFGNPCGQQLSSDNAFSTLINGDDRFRALMIDGKANSDITVRNLWFANGLAPTDVGNHFGGGLWVFPVTPSNAKVIIENCAFSGNEAAFGAGLAIVGGGETRVRNSLFVANHAVAAYAAYAETSEPPGVYFTNNTVIDNTTDGNNAGAAVFASGSGGQYFVANNILWDNDGADIVLGGSTIGDTYFHNNDVADRLGSATVESGNLSVMPQFAGSLIDFTPAEGSPLINAGIRPPSVVPVPPPFHQNWSTGTLDMKGNTRVRGGEIDIGAYEAPTPLLNNGFE